MKRLMEMMMKMEDVVLISSSKIKNQILKEMSQENQLFPVSFRTFQDLIEDFGLKYDLLARITLAINEKTSPEIAAIKLKNSLVVSRKYQNQKIHDLLRIKNKYQSFLTSSFRSNFYKAKNVIIINSSETNDLYHTALSKLKELTNIIYYQFEEDETKKIIYLFPDLKSEIEYLIQDIGKLLDSGVSPENIKIQKPDNIYLPYLKEAFYLSGIPLEIEEGVPLYHFEIVQKFLFYLKQNLKSDLESGFSKALASLKTEANLILNKLTEVLNSYLRLPFLIRDIYDDLVFQLKNTLYSERSSKNSIKVADYQKDYLDPNDQLFILGFNQDLFPATFRDDDYLLDYERERLGLMSSKKKNQIERQKAFNLLKRGNVQISCLKRHQGLDLPISSLITMMEDPEIIEGKRSQTTYSPELDRLRLGKALDNYYKYQERSPDLDDLLATWPKIAYKDYQNSFTGITPNTLGALLKKNLSYTAINQYYNCGFQYYLERVLKIKRLGNEEALFTGNLFHKCLEELLKGEKTASPKPLLEEIIKNYLEEEKRDISPKEKFFLGKHLEVLLLFYDYLIKEYDASSFEEISLEKSFNLKINDDFSFLGKIDKVQKFTYENQDYLTVIDYKTGSADYDLNLTIYGLNMQLLVYFYLLKSEGDYNFGGAYLQRVLPTNVFGQDPKLNYQEQFSKYFRKNGYSPDSYYLLEKIDKNYDNEKSTIEGIKVTKNGFHANSMKRMLSKEVFEELLNLVEIKINEATKKISSGVFPINPKLSNTIDSCRYCSYRDLCFREDRDYERLKEYKNFEFLKENI